LAGSFGTSSELASAAFVTVAELWKWAEVGSWGKPNRSAAERHVMAACCLSHKVPLVTLNWADFVDFAERQGPVLLGEDA
jgi:hypothetical protein